MRRLPVYILLDTSSSMCGEPIDAVQKGVGMLLETLRTDPYALETAYISVITFDSHVNQICPLTELSFVEIPEITAYGMTSLGQALEFLGNAVDTEVIKTNSERKGDWRPLVFIMTDGIPTDNYRRGIRAMQKHKFGMVVACAAGKKANTDILKEITQSVVSRATVDRNTIQAFFKWVSASVVVGSMKVEDSGMNVQDLSDLPPPPSEITIV